MDVLTAQYPALYVRKFKVSFADFQPSASNIGTVFLAQEKKRCYPFAFQLKPTIPFSSPNITPSQIFLGDQHVVDNLPTIDASFFAKDITTPITDINGIQAGLSPSGRYDNALSDIIMLPFDAPSKFYLILDLQGGDTINDLTAGELFIWYSIFFLK